MGVVRLLCLAAVAAGAVGCVSSRPRIVAALGTAPTEPAATAAYVLACPDVVDVRVGGRPDLTGRYAIEADGAIRPGNLPRVRIDGTTPFGAAELLAAAAGVARSQVIVGVAEYRSRQVFLLGAGGGRERAVAYQGPETVVELLRRCGGLGETADAADVHVVRPHVAAGRRPEVFPVDLESILLRGEPATNVRIEPYDQVYIGEARLATLAKHLPFASRNAN